MNMFQGFYVYTYILISYAPLLESILLLYIVELFVFTCYFAVFTVSSNPAYVTQSWNNYLDISEVLLKVKRLEEMKTESSQRSQGIGQFINWLTENGAQVDGLSIAEFPGYDLGLKAQTDFAENQLILEIPRGLIFSTYTAASELTILQNDPLVQHMPQVALAIALLIERHKENSKWKSYLDMLPSSYNTVLYMKTNDMIELKGSPTLGT